MDIPVSTHIKFRWLGVLVAFFLVTSACNVPALLPNQDPTDKPDATEKPFSGLRAALEADVPTGTSIDSTMMQTSIDILKKRLKGLGIKNGSVKQSEGGQILIELPDDPNNEATLAALKQTGLVEFVDMSAATTPPVPGTVIVTDYGMQNPSGQENVWHTVMTGKAIESAQVTSMQGRAVVAFQLNPESKDLFAGYTAQHIGKILAIVLDKKVLSAPVINTAITDGKGVITGDFTQETAAQLAVWISSGSLPFPLKVVEAIIVKPD
jgi:preprotein translocase subunit SecD